PSVAADLMISASFSGLASNTVGFLLPRCCPHNVALDCASRSTRRTRTPASSACTAMLVASVDLPLPPLVCTKAQMRAGMWRLPVDSSDGHILHMTLYVWHIDTLTVNE